MRKLFLIIALILLMPFEMISQEKKQNDSFLSKANKAFSEKKYKEAEKKFRKSDHQDVSGSKPTYNLGNTVFRQSYPAESLSNFQRALSKANTKDEKHKIFHNMGNCYMALKNYQGAVEAYKNALRNNPNDDETRYNYALAKKLLEENPPPPDNNDDNQDNQDQNQDQDNQDQDNNDEDNQDDKNQDNQDQNEQPSNPKNKNIEALLEAVQNQEKNTQQKVNDAQKQGRPIKQEKEW